MQLMATDPMLGSSSKQWLHQPSLTKFPRVGRQPQSKAAYNWDVIFAISVSPDLGSTSTGYEAHFAKGPLV